MLVGDIYIYSHIYIYSVLRKDLSQSHGSVWDVGLTELQAPEMFVKFR